jgi:chemotaxis response regulator CheB
MPRAAFECGAVMRQYSLSHIADGILEACDDSNKAQARTGDVRRTIRVV